MYRQCSYALLLRWGARQLSVNLSIRNLRLRRIAFAALFVAVGVVLSFGALAIRLGAYPMKLVMNDISSTGVIMATYEPKGQPAVWMKPKGHPARVTFQRTGGCHWLNWWRQRCCSQFKRPVSRESAHVRTTTHSPRMRFTESCRQFSPASVS